MERAGRAPLMVAVTADPHTPETPATTKFGQVDHVDRCGVLPKAIQSPRLSQNTITAVLVAAGAPLNHAPRPWAPALIFW